MKCKDCKWWWIYEDSEPALLGECRRYALGPKWDDPEDNCDILRPYWPQTNPNDWCGEFKAKE